jgi:Sulfotransferase family
MNSLAESPIFIAGYPRSGTTLLPSLLDSHPDLLVYPRETQFFRLVLPLFKHDPQLALDFLIWDTSQSSWYAAHSYEDGRGIGQFHDQLRDRFRQGGGSPKALLQAIMLAHAHVTDQAHKRFWVEKTPHNERYARTIFGWFPAAKMIYIVRDPRATLASVRGFQKIMGHKEMSALRFCIEWRASLRANRRYAVRYPILTIRYEDLVGDPQPTLLTICDFLGISFQDSLLQPTFDGADFTGFSSYSSFATQFKTIDRSSLEKWKKALPRRDVQAIDYLLAQDMAELSYAGDRAALPKRALALAWLYRALYLVGQPILHAPWPLLSLVRRAVGAAPNRVDQFKQWKQTQPENSTIP